MGGWGGWGGVQGCKEVNTLSVRCCQIDPKFSEYLEKAFVFGKMRAEHFSQVVHSCTSEDVWCEGSSVTDVRTRVRMRELM